MQTCDVRFSMSLKKTPEAEKVKVKITDIRVFENTFASAATAQKILDHGSIRPLIEAGLSKVVTNAFSKKLRTMKAPGGLACRRAMCCARLGASSGKVRLKVERVVGKRVASSGLENSAPWRQLALVAHLDPAARTAGMGAENMGKTKCPRGCIVPNIGDATQGKLQSNECRRAVRNHTWTLAQIESERDAPSRDSLGGANQTLGHPSGWGSCSRAVGGDLGRLSRLSSGDTCWTPVPPHSHLESRYAVLTWRARGPPRFVCQPWIAPNGGDPAECPDAWVQTMPV